MLSSTRLFDAAWYLEHYPDVAAIDEDPILHYLFSGAGEGRNPGPDFDTRAYVDAHPEIVELGINPLVHYLTNTPPAAPPKTQRPGLPAANEAPPDDAVYALVSTSVLFDRAWYLTQYPDVAESGDDPIRHYLERGAAEGRDPGPEFDTIAYLEANPDVAEAGWNPLHHFLARGSAEGRALSLTDSFRPPAMTEYEREDYEAIVASGLFDGAWYREHYPDVAASAYDPALHYLRIGAGEGRDPGPSFRTLAYREANPDVAETDFNPLLHYVIQGQAEGRALAPPEHDLDASEAEDIRIIEASGLFDRGWYLREYPDVAELAIDPIVHYLRDGASEGRRPGPTFDGQAYLEANPDVAADGFNPLLHFLLIGESEGRIPGNAAAAAVRESIAQQQQDIKTIASSYLFDRDWYFEHYRDVADSGVDPIVHYLQIGAREGRDPGPNFSTRGYLAANRDVAEAGFNPLLHYVLQGANEGRAIPATAALDRADIGGARRRDYELISASDLFDANWYRDQNADVARENIDPVLHYLVDGGPEGRDPGPRFNSRAYLSRHPEVAEARENPLVHFLRAGSPREDRATAVLDDPETGRAETALWFFMGDTLDWLETHERLTGVGRVTAEIFFASLSGGSHVPFWPCVAGEGRAPLASLSRLEIAYYLASKVRRGSPGSSPLDDFGLVPRASPLRPIPGDHVLFTGVVWTRAYSDLFLELITFGINYSVLVYDIIPIEYPEIVGNAHAEGFAIWLETVVTTASVVFVSGASVRDGILRWALVKGLAFNASIVIVPFGSMETGSVASAEVLATHESTYRVELSNFVLSVGTIDRRKNQAMLGRLWKRLAAERGGAEIPQLVLVGREDLKLADGDPEVAELLAARKIIVLENLSDRELFGLYRACRFTMFPSMLEGYGLPVAESLQFGKLCIASALPCIREHAGDLPWYFEPGDEAAGYELLKRALDDDAARAEAEKRIASEFIPRSWRETYETVATALADPDGTLWKSRLRVRDSFFEIFPIDVAATLERASRWCTAVSPEVSILIINWNAAHLTRECVRQIWANTEGHTYEIIIADNGSDAENRLPVEHLGAGVRYLPLGINRYFGEANNIAAEAATGPYLCFLNNDAFVQRGWLTALMAELEQHPSAGAAGPAFFFPDGRVQEAGATVDAGGYPVRRGRGETHLSVDLAQSEPVDYISAAALLVRTETFFEIGGFDLAFEPAYYEDVDVCFKIRRLGKDVRYCPGARVVHIEGSAANDDDEAVARRKILGDLNRDKFVARWKPYLENRDRFDRPMAQPPKSRQLSRSLRPRKKAAIYTPYALTPGGGERVLLTATAALSESYDCELVTPQPYSRLRLRNLGDEFGIDLSGVECTTEDRFLESEHPALMITIGNSVVPVTPGRGIDNLYICQFPFPISSEEVAETRTLVDGYRAYVVYSEYSRAHVLAQMSAYQLTARPVEVIYPPVQSIVGDARVKRKGMILSVGRFFVGGHRKRHDAMIDAFRKYIGLVGEHAAGELHLAGSSMPDAHQLAYIDSLKARADGLPVFFHVNPTSGGLHELFRDAAIYWHGTGIGSDLMANPYEAEHFGITIAEAMSAECVALAFNAGGPREIITSGVDGFLYDTVDDLVALTRSLLVGDKVQMRPTIGKSAARRAADFSERAFTDAWSSLVSGRALAAISVGLER